jgi:hypothetical protein
LLQVVAVDAQAVLAKLIIKLQEAQVAAQPAKPVLDLRLLELVAVVVRKLLAETAAPHGVVANLEQRARSEPVVTVVFTLQLLAAVAVAAILAAVAVAVTTAARVPTAAAAAAADPVFTLLVAHAHKDFKLVMAKLSLLTQQALLL